MPYLNLGWWRRQKGLGQVSLSSGDGSEKREEDEFASGKGTYVGSFVAMSQWLERKERNEKIRPETAGTQKKSGDTSCSITTVEETV